MGFGLDNLIKVADDPFGDTDCSTHGIDIDLLYFVKGLFIIVFQK